MPERAATNSAATMTMNDTPMPSRMPTKIIGKAPGMTIRVHSFHREAP